MTESYYGDGNCYRGEVSKDSEVRTIKVGVEPMWQDVDISCLPLFAMRYALHRRTTAPWSVCNALRKIWGELRDHEREQILHEIRNEMGANDDREWLGFLRWAENKGGGGSA